MPDDTSKLCSVHAATVGVVTETNAEKAIEELKAYEVLCYQLQFCATTHLCSCEQPDTDLVALCTFLAYSTISDVSCKCFFASSTTLAAHAADCLHVNQLDIAHTLRSLMASPGLRHT